MLDTLTYFNFTYLPTSLPRTEVFTSLSSDTYYFNAISCISADHCVAVAEGENVDGNPTIYAFTTTDGGKTWTNSLFAEELGMSAVKMLSENEVWLGGVVAADRKPQGIHIHTKPLTHLLTHSLAYSRWFLFFKRWRINVYFNSNT